MSNKTAPRVLARLRVMFPSFAAAVSNDQEMMQLMIDEWAEGLAGLDDEAIRCGFSRLRGSGADFAPSLPKFIQLCGGRPEHWSSTWSGIVKKGAEFGITEDQFIYPQNFARRVGFMAEKLEDSRSIEHDS